MFKMRKTVLSLLLITSLGLQSMLSHGCFMIPASDESSPPSHEMMGHHGQHQYDASSFSAVQDSQQSMQMHMDCCKHPGDCSDPGCGMTQSAIPGIAHIPLNFTHFETPETRAFHISTAPVENPYHPPIIR